MDSAIEQGERPEQQIHVEFYQSLQEESLLFQQLVAFCNDKRKVSDEDFDLFAIGGIVEYEDLLPTGTRSGNSIETASTSPWQQREAVTNGQRFINIFRDSPDEMFAVATGEDGSIVGFATITRVPNENGEGIYEIAYLVDRSKRNRGIAGQLLHTIIQEAAMLGIGEVLARIDDNNPASRGALQAFVRQHQDTISLEERQEGPNHEYILHISAPQTK